MRYTLRSRFQGTLLGAAAGAQWETMQPSHLLDLQISTTLPLPAVQGMAALDAALPLIQHLITEGTQSLPWHRWVLPTDFAVGDRASWLAIFSLPLALYCHDNLPRLHHCLQEATQAWQWRETEAQVALSMGYLFAATCGSQTVAASPVAVVEAVRPDRLGGLPAAQWQWLQTALEQRHSLAIAATHLPPEPAASATLALALLIFLTSPGDIALSCNRAAGIARSTATPIWVGAILGSYGGGAALQYRWSDAVPAAISWRHQADALLASWAGIYNPAAAPLSATALEAIATPQPRPWGGAAP